MGGERKDALLLLDFQIQNALVAHLVKAPSLHTAGIGVVALAASDGLAAPMHVPQRDIVHAGGGKGGRGGGGVGREGGGQIGVAAEQIDAVRILRLQIGDGSGVKRRGGKGVAVQIHPQMGKGMTAGDGRIEDHHILGEGGACPDRAGGVGIVVAGGDDEGDVWSGGHLPQQKGHRLLADRLRVEEVAAQQNQIHPPLGGQQGQ